MSGFAYALIVAALVSSLVALSVAARAVNLASRRRQAADAGLPLQLQSLRHSLQELTEAHEQLAMSVRMIKTRKMQPQTAKTETPDPYQQPDAWRAHMNAARATAGRTPQ